MTRRRVTSSSILLIAIGAIIFYDLVIFELAKAGLIFSSIRTVGYHVDIQTPLSGILTIAVVPSVLGLGIGLFGWRNQIFDIFGFLAFLPIVLLTTGFAFFFLGFFGALCSLHDVLACMSASY